MQYDFNLRLPGAKRNIKFGISPIRKEGNKADGARVKNGENEEIYVFKMKKK
jgi:hypothetical protein